MFFFVCEDWVSGFCGSMMFFLTEVFGFFSSVLLWLHRNKN